MFKIILGFAVIFMLIYIAYKTIVNMDDEALELLMKRVPIFAVCTMTAIFAVTFIVVTF